MTTETEIETKAVVEPLEDHVLVQPLKADDKIGMIHLPDQAKERPTQGTVLAVGPGKYADGSLVAVRVSEGDVVIYSKYAGTAVKVNGEDCVLLRESNLLAKIYHE